MTAATASTTFHEGELAIQERADATAQARNSGRMLSDTIISGAIKFVKKQPMLVAGTVDSSGRLWASVVVGPAGFMEAAPDRMEIDLREAERVVTDPLWANIRQDPRVGLLIIDLRTRARLRVNGRVEFGSADRLHVQVEQAYPNCPKYIQRRSYRPAFSTSATTETTMSSGMELTELQQRWLSAADTLFVASQHPNHGVDISHRGGNPGFVQVLSPSRLRIPDYVGNGMFNTFGNFAVYPRAGLLVPDFEHGRTLQLTGRPRVKWDVDDPHETTGGTRRFWEFDVERWVQTDGQLPGDSEFIDYSPHNPAVAAGPASN